MMQHTLEAPWYTFGKKLKALFAQDSDIEVSDVYKTNEASDKYVVDVSVLSHEKFVALDRVLVKEKRFGNVTLIISLFDLENDTAHPGIEIFKAVFKGNPAVAEIISKPDQTGTDWHYVCFKPEVVQFFDDDMTDVNGNFTGLMEDIAKKAFEDNYRGVNFCTAAVGASNKPQDE